MFLLQRDDDSGGLGRELSEDEYDALNDETFTHAVRDDWEGEAVSEKKRSSALDHNGTFNHCSHSFQMDTRL